MSNKRFRAVAVCLVPVVLLGVLAFWGCSRQAPEKKEPVSTYKSNGTYTELGDEKLSREGLEALPKKHGDMTPQQARETVIAFWRYCKTALWIPDDRYEVYKEEEGVNVLKRWMEPGGVYAGLPYVGTATGNIYRLFDFMDPDTGVVNVREVGRDPGTFGGMCSSGCYWAWARVMNSADYRWCADSVVSRGYLRVGPYTYPDSWTKFIEVGHQGTDEVCRDNGEQVMFQSYAAMEVADGMISLYEKNGHTHMCAIAPTVVYHEDGTINGMESWLCIIEQGGIWEDAMSENGIPYQRECSMERRFTFKQLYEGAYIPYTFGELIGTDPIEETEASFSHQEETITEKQLFNAKVTSNYHISDVYIYVYDEAGNEIYKHVVRTRIPSTKELKIHRQVDRSYTWGDWETVSAGNKVKVEVQLGTGERPIIYEGQLRTDN